LSQLISLALKGVLTVATTTEFANQVLTLTNEFRAQNGLSALKLNTELNAAAYAHSEDMAKQDYFDHIGKNGSKPWDRAKVVGYEAQAMGENIAAGYTTAAEVVQGWINSPGHRANLLNTKYTELGVGYFYLTPDTGSVNYNTYWTQLFGSGDLNPNSFLPTPTPAPTPTPPPTLAGNDELIGGSTGEQLAGEGGNDRIFGNGGNDILLGGSGNDLLNGGSGADLMTGGDGTDSFVFDSGRTFATADFGIDRIVDFAKGTDKVVLDKTSFGAISSTQIGVVRRDGLANTSSKQIVYSRGTGKLFFNPNGSASGFGKGGAFAIVDSDNNSSTAAPVLAASDFQIVM
jgi:Ca2+-binding RTX toxin-like protein